MQFNIFRKDTLMVSKECIKYKLTENDINRGTAQVGGTNTVGIVTTSGITTTVSGMTYCQLFLRKF